MEISNKSCQVRFELPIRQILNPPKLTVTIREGWKHLDAGGGSDAFAINATRASAERERRAFLGQIQLDSLVGLGCSGLFTLSGSSSLWPWLDRSIGSEGRSLTPR